VKQPAELRRRVARASLCLALGILFTWLSAWGIVLAPHNVALLSWGRPPIDVRNDLSPRGWTWMFECSTDFGVTRFKSTCHASSGPPPWGSPPFVQSPIPSFLAASAPERESALHARRWYSGIDPAQFIDRVRFDFHFDELAGWPMRALRHEVRTGSTEIGDVIQEIRSGIEPPRTLRPNSATITPARLIPIDRLSALPLRPVWPGFAVNAAFYGAIAWTLMFVAGAIRRARRHGADQCKACAYDRRGLRTASDPCPECGRTGATPSAPTPITAAP